MPPTPWPALAPDALATEQVRTWLLPAVYERLSRRTGQFPGRIAAHGRPLCSFWGIDYDHDEGACARLDNYVRWVQQIVAQYQGTFLDLNIGDKGSYLYINFGAPVAHEDNSDARCGHSPGAAQPAG